MVGVKGKYKGCNTCRSRRVKCDNTRPLCKKCTDHGRVCEGYARETVFIVGTSEGKGRVASHPPRNLGHSQAHASTSSGSAKKARTTPSSDKGSQTSRSQPPPPLKLDLVPIQPLGPAWTDTLATASLIGLQQFRFACLHTSLDNVSQTGIDIGGETWEGETKLRLPRSHRVHAQPMFGAAIFSLRARLFVRMQEATDLALHQQNTLSNNVVLILYEQNSSAANSNKPTWRSPDLASHPVYSRGPGHYQLFPAHHFFSRLYRPSALFAAVLNRQPTLLSSPEWCTVPYEHHPKTSLDTLLDLTALLPSLLSRADRIIPLPASIGQRLKAKDLLLNCTGTERQLLAWYQGVEEVAALNRENPLLYWLDPATSSSSPQSGGSDLHAPRSDRVPFVETYAFASPMLGMAHIYYWTTLVALYSCIKTLVESISASAAAAAAAAGARSSPVYQPRDYFQQHTQTQHQPRGEEQQLQAHAQLYFQQPSPAPPTSPFPLPNVDPSRYSTREIRRLAANICRSLDWALQSEGIGHPDALAAPLWVVESFYQGIGSSVPSGDGELERLWCAGFRRRLEDRASEVELGVCDGGKRWVEIAQIV